ncbi:hypothetical protein [Microbacterium phyllosphaerae]|uniref:hypothetical protein n=1 Tax=Microbacterium phyllosphaerae TaxID=124798 RepID=UPI002169779F|nr:hypothetical protein [Microbacterium phyllosphaerae]MCS3444197.1 ABC-type antimicrobial peptide transport system permease subunit [Microbacterium phyllosphaerae]
MFSFSADSVWLSLGYIGIALAVLAVIVALVASRGRRNGSRSIALDAALTICAWWLIFAALGAVSIIVKVFAVDWAELSGRTLVRLDWPSSIPCIDAGSMTETTATALTCGGAELTDFTVANASFGLRALAGAAQLSAQALPAIPVVILAVICFNTLRGRAFSRTITRALVGGAIAVLVFGVAADLLGTIAATAGLREALPADNDWYPGQFQLTVTPLPFVGALMLAALAAVFREGLKLQSERDDLQRANEALEDETRGLV